MCRNGTGGTSSAAEDITRTAHDLKTTNTAKIRNFWGSHQRSVNLPKLEIPFYGKKLRWSEFCDTFEAIFDQKLSNIKTRYINRKLTEEGNRLY